MSLEDQSYFIVMERRSLDEVFLLGALQAEWQVALIFHRAAD